MSGLLNYSKQQQKTSKSGWSAEAVKSHSTALRKLELFPENGFLEAQTALAVGVYFSPEISCDAFCLKL